MSQDRTKTTDFLRQSIASLVDCPRKRVMRDDGSVIWADEISLWDQLADALATGSESGTHGVPTSRPPCDVDIAELRRDIQTQVEGELRRLKTPPRDTVEGSIRTLSALVTSKIDEDLISHWESRFRRWVRRGQTLLGEITRPRSIRGASCPACEASYIMQPTPEGPIRLPALSIVFHERRIRHAECLACHHTWWRGEDLNVLADAIRSKDGAYQIN